MVGVIVVMCVVGFLLWLLGRRPRRDNRAEVIMARWRAEQEAYERYKDKTWVGEDVPIEAFKESLGDSGEAWLTDSEGKIR